MSDVEITSAFLAELAGWEAMKQARGIVASERVLNSDWEPPLLKGAVQAGTTTYKTGLVIRSRFDVENICPCREARQKGIICSHAVAVGLHFLETKNGVPGKSTALPPKAAPVGVESKAPRNPKALRRALAGEAGEDLEIAVILPPNFADAIARGKVMLCCEGKWHRGRSPLNALPMDRAFTVTEEDMPLLNMLEALNGGETTGMAMLTVAQFTSLLPCLINHPRVSFGKSEPVSISAEPLKLRIRAILEQSGEILLRQIGSVPGVVFGAGTSWCRAGTSIRPIGLPAGVEAVLGAPMRITRAQVPLFLNQTWPALVKAADVEANFTLENFELEMGSPRFKLHLTGGLAMLDARLECFYGTQSLSEMTEGFWLPDPGKATCYRTRNLEAEQQAMARLFRCGFANPDSSGVYKMRGQDAVLNFFARHYPRLEKEWETTLEERLERSASQNIEWIEPQFQVTPSGENWFDFNVAYGTKTGQKFSQADIQRLLLSGQSHTRLPNGKFGVMDTGALEDLREVLVDCAPRQHAGGYRMDNAQSGFLQATLERQSGWKVQAPAAWTQRASTQRLQAKPAPPELGHLEQVLRPYQKEGVGWLRFLRDNGFGGILADEMGLGKTVQVLAHLVASKREQLNRAAVKALKPSLVVCPSSLVFNWGAEAEKFAPELKKVLIHGPARQEKLARISDYDMVITSYALLRRDFEIYQGIDFDTVVLDEAQHIKNRQTQNAQAVKAVRSRHRLVLTGTPLENSVLDLWSIFDFLMPGYLGSAKDFRERYEAPVTRENNADARDRLARRVRPFLLRRLKREVAADLPERIEQVGYCELNDEQRTLYQQVLEASRAEVVNAVNANGLARSRMVVLTALLRLRQICCDPRLLKPGKATGDADDGQSGSDSPLGATPEAPTPAGPEQASGKVEFFRELLEEVIDGGHRVLVFSQFTTMLRLLREELTAQQVKSCYLDGSTKDRAAVVQTFQSDGSIPVFLISLKAGGVGLNLTGADTVIHFDPWWNPAVEAQATDRAHRIGQTKVVTSYKLITRGTVEEKILNLQQRKRTLLEGMLGHEDQFTAALDWNEVQELLAS